MTVQFLSYQFVLRNQTNAISHNWRIHHKISLWRKKTHRNNTLQCLMWNSKIGSEREQAKR